MEQDIRVLLDQIHGFYKKALNRLPVKGIRSLAPRLLKAGLCIGFLDPISNIILNTISYCPSPLPSLEEGVLARKTILSKIITDTDDPRVFELPLDAHTAHSMTVARRSLEGLVSFLIYYYRYLAEAEALRYLRLAGADLLVAVWLIDQDRNKPSVSVSDLLDRKPPFDISSPTTKIALRCAAASARHPEPAILVSTSLLLASSLGNVSEYLHRHPRLSIRMVRCLRQWLSLQDCRDMPPMDIWRPMYLATLRLAVGKRKEKKEEKTSGYTVFEAVASRQDPRALPRCSFQAIWRWLVQASRLQPPQGWLLLWPNGSCLKHHPQHCLVWLYILYTMSLSLALRWT